MSVFFTLANAGAPLFFFLFGTPLTLLVFAAIVFGEAYVATRIIVGRRTKWLVLVFWIVAVAAMLVPARAGTVTFSVQAGGSATATSGPGTLTRRFSEPDPPALTTRSQEPGGTLDRCTSTEAAGYGAIFLTLAYFISVGVEWLVAHIFVKPVDRTKMTRWSWRANLYTYEGMLLLLLTVAVWDRLT